jgi:glycosyltransferase involved in cell wall biosynthesis
MVPSKFYGAMSAGKPVLFIGPRTSEVALAIQDSCAGIVVEPGDAHSLKRALADVVSNGDLRADMAARALQFAKTKWSSEIALERWSALIESVSHKNKLPSVNFRFNGGPPFWQDCASKGIGF